MTTAFPLMFLGHYYDWLDLPGKRDYMGEFFPAGEARFKACNQALLEQIFSAPRSDAGWLAAVCCYLAYYPYALLECFSRWALPEDCLPQVDSFIQADRARTLPELAARLTACVGDNGARTEAVCWLGTEFPYALLTRFHQYLFES